VKRDTKTHAEELKEYSCMVRNRYS